MPKCLECEREHLDFQHNLKKPKKCDMCNKILNPEEIEDSQEIIGGNRYFCHKHLNLKMDW